MNRIFFQHKFEVYAVNSLRIPLHNVNTLSLRNALPTP